MFRSPPNTTSDMVESPWLSYPSTTDKPSSGTSKSQPIRQRTMSEASPASSSLGGRGSFTLQRQCNIEEHPAGGGELQEEVPSISSHISACQSQPKRQNVLKRAMTLPVNNEESQEPLLQLGPHFSYAPLRSPMRCSKPLVPNSETSETLLDIPVLTVSANSEQDSEPKMEHAVKRNVSLSWSAS